MLILLVVLNAFIFATVYGYGPTGSIWLDGVAAFSAALIADGLIGLSWVALDWYRQRRSE